MHTALAVNPTADGGRAGAAADRIEARMVRAGHAVVRLEAPDAAGLRDLVRHHVDHHLDRLVIAGGDGLVHQLLPAVASRPTVVGIVPVGSGNDFARGLGLPLGTEAAVDAALGPWAPVDAVRVGDRWTASVATAGFSGLVTARANGLGWPRGRHRYTAATLLELPRLRPFALRVRTDGDELDTSCSLIAIANTALFGGGMAISPDASCGDGLLDVTIVGAVSPLTLALWFPKVFAGRHLGHPAVRTLRARHIELDARGVDLWADGERVGPLPARLECVPGALRIAGATW